MQFDIVLADLEDVKPFLTLVLGTWEAVKRYLRVLGVTVSTNAAIRSGHSRTLTPFSITARPILFLDARNTLKPLRFISELFPLTYVLRSRRAGSRIAGVHVFSIQKNRERVGHTVVRI